MNKHSDVANDSRGKRTAQLAAIAVAIASLTIATQAHAHPIHTTLTVATSTSRELTLNIRAFSDDFSATIARFAGRKPPTDSSAPDADVLRYVRSQFGVRDANGAALTLESCGTRRSNELHWLCFKVALPAGARGVRITNQMLTELHADQVNIVQVEQSSGRKTMLFTKGSASSALGG